MIWKWLQLLIEIFVFMNIQKLTFVFYSSRIVGKQMPFYAINLDLHLNFSALDFEHSLTNHDLLSFAKWIYAVANARLYNLRAHQGALYLNKLETVSKQDIFLHIFSSSSSTNANLWREWMIVKQQQLVLMRRKN